MAEGEKRLLKLTSTEVPLHDGVPPKRTNKKHTQALENDIGLYKKPSFV